jgi:hypothetical protein
LAADYLPIQASAVPCEQVFSSSAETDTRRRNRIHPVLMEMLQMLKFAYKEDRKATNFLDGWTSVISELEGHLASAQQITQLFDSSSNAGVHADRVDKIMSVIGED